MLVRACAGGSGCKASQINAGIRRWTCAGVLDGQRLGFSREDGEGGRGPVLPFRGAVITCWQLRAKCRRRMSFKQVRVDAVGRADGDGLRARRALAPFLLN